MRTLKMGLALEGCQEFEIPILMMIFFEISEMAYDPLRYSSDWEVVDDELEG